MELILNKGASMLQDERVIFQVPKYHIPVPADNIQEIHSIAIWNYRNYNKERAICHDISSMKPLNIYLVSIIEGHKYTSQFHMHTLMHHNVGLIVNEILLGGTQLRWSAAWHGNETIPI